MKRKTLRHSLLLSLLTFTIFMCNSSTSEALIIIDELSDAFTVGDFMIFGDKKSAGTGQNYEVLKFKPRGNGTTGTAFDGSSQTSTFEADQGPHFDVNLGDIWSHLNANSVTSTTQLFFGFDVNQNDCLNDSSQVKDCIDITDLRITIDALTFTLGGETVRVLEIHGNGSNLSEMLIKIELNFDFMSQYSASSTSEFKLQATHTGANAGFDEYFLTTGFGISAVPEPTSLLLFASGMVGTFIRRKTIKKMLSSKA